MSGGGGGCSRFKQNAWKKEMCSNCYKTKDEHQDRPKPALPHLPLVSPSQSILKGWDLDKKKKRKSVSFPMEECEVIGFGGEELSSDEEMDYEEQPSSREESGEEPDGENDKVLKKLTKTNTEFNSVLGNLSGAKPPVQTLLLGGQRQRDAPAVHVTVQPFNNSLPNSRKIHLNKLLQDTTPSLTMLPAEKIDKAPVKENETRKVNITRGSIITKNHESVKNKLYMQNILNGKNEKRNSYNLIQEKVYITTNLSGKTDVGETDENIDYLKGQKKNCVVLNCNGISLIGLDKGKENLLESRELAGEPDGKADSDEAEIPITPPPRISFLHRDAVDIKTRIVEPYESERINTIETLHEIKRSVEPVERRLAPSPEARLNELVEIRRLSVGDCDGRRFDSKSCSPDNLEFRKSESISNYRLETAERRMSEISEGIRKIEPSLRKLSDCSDCRRNVDKIDNRLFTEASESWKIDAADSRRNIITLDEAVKCTKRQAPKPPQNESESEVEFDVKAESDTGSECCERTMLRVESTETTSTPVRPARPEVLKISVSSDQPTSASSSPEPEKLDNFYDVRRTSPKREPPPLPPTTPEPRKSPPEPLPRHKAAFIDVEKKKTKMKETIKKLLRFGTKEEMDMEVQSPRVRPQIIHPLDLNKSAVQVLPSTQILKSVSPETPSTPTPPPCFPGGRPTKPPPPPRSESLNLMERLKTKAGCENNIYANLGEARSGITPVKPVRTGSMREVGGKLALKDQPPCPSDTKTYCSDIARASASSNDQDNLYEAIGSASSAPECDMGQLTYYGSETESDTYSASHLHETGGCEGRRGSLVTPYLSLEENFAALSQLSLQAINHLITNVLERDNMGGSIKFYCVDKSSRKDLCGAIFVEADKTTENTVDSTTNSRTRKVMLAVVPSQLSLLLPPCVPVIAKFADSLPQDLLCGKPYDTIGEVTVLPGGEVTRLMDSRYLDNDSGDSTTEQRLLVLLQVLQIIGQIDSRHCLLDNFIVLKDSRKQMSVSYLHKVGGSGEEYWKTSVDILCDRYRIAKPLRLRLSACQSDSEALLAVTSWLYGPPPSLGRESLVSWLALQRGYALRSYLARSDIAAMQHVTFLSSNVDLTKLHRESSLMDDTADS